MVAGYYVDQRSITDVVDEVGRLADSGYRRVKIMLKGDDPAFDIKYVSAVAGKMPGGVAADAHWSWSTLTEAKRICRQFDGLGLNFLEDPFAASDIRLTHELRRDLVTPIAAGEDIFGARVVSDLVQGIDILRVMPLQWAELQVRSRRSTSQQQRGGRCFRTSSVPSTCTLHAPSRM